MYYTLHYHAIAQLGYLTYCLYMIGSESPAIPVALRHETLIEQFPPLPIIDVKK